ncbi:MAG: abortive infection family protein [Gammaproteobacteria bacterium]
MGKMEPRISPLMRNAFQESYSGYAVLREIEQDFNGAGVALGDVTDDTVAGMRRTLVAQYYSTVNWTSDEDVNRVLNAFRAHMMRLEHVKNPECDAEVEKLKKYLEGDDFSYDKGKITDMRSPSAGLRIDLSRFSIDTTQVQRNMDIMDRQVESAPAVAIGVAKDMVESCYKAILQDANAGFSDSENIPELAHKAADVLNLLPQNISERKKGEKAIKKVLGSLTNIVQGTAELRNQYGSGHGRKAGHAGLSPRHARLAARAAVTLVAFLLETAEQRKKN